MARKRHRRPSAFLLIGKTLHTKRHEKPPQHKRRVQEELKRAHRLYLRGGFSAIVKHHTRHRTKKRRKRSR